MHDNDLERCESRARKGGTEWLTFAERLAGSKPASDIFVAKGTLGEDCGIIFPV